MLSNACGVLTASRSLERNEVSLGRIFSVIIVSAKISADRK